MSNAKQKAEEFIEHQKAFRLGTLLTESSHPQTANFSEVIQQDLIQGIKLLLEVDQEIAPATKPVFESQAYQKLIQEFVRALKAGNQLFFTGCGATGRLSILLESMWREFWQRAQKQLPEKQERFQQFENQVLSVMAGGDFALIKSVEGFEDFPVFGKHQLKESGVSQGDVVVAITEGGETPFVIGTAWQGLESGASVFFVYNNPTDLLCQHVTRSREIIEHEQVTTLDLTTGPMAIAGSTRMQATTSELLVVGAALETALRDIWEANFPELDGSLIGINSEQTDFPETMAELVEQLKGAASLQAMARLTEFEKSLYDNQGLVTYAASEFLLDVLTDTTERSPTFSLPSYRTCVDNTSAISWSFVKDPTQNTEETWNQLLRRKPRGITWDSNQYEQLEAPEAIQNSPPKLDNEEIYRFQIGNENDSSRYEGSDSGWIALIAGEEVSTFDSQSDSFQREFQNEAQKYSHPAILSIGETVPQTQGNESFHIPIRMSGSPLKIWEHLAVKLVLNTISTATMACMGRVKGNWMIHVNTSNKKLIDRGTRLIAELTGLSYEESCLRLHEAMEEIAPTKHLTQGTTSPVAVTLQKISG